VALYAIQTSIAVMGALCMESIDSYSRRSVVQMPRTSLVTMCLLRGPIHRVRVSMPRVNAAISKNPVCS
jgi:hypothetical protein